jgi:hypothetical protein
VVVAWVMLFLFRAAPVDWLVPATGPPYAPNSSAAGMARLDVDDGCEGGVCAGVVLLVTVAGGVKD